MALMEVIERIIDPVVLNRVTSGLMYSRVTKAGTLRSARLYRSSSGGITGTWYFNLFVDGSGLWTGTDRFSFTSGIALSSKTGLNVAVSLGDVIQLDLEQTGGGIILGTLVLILEIETSVGVIEEVVAGAGIDVDISDPSAPEISVDSSITDALAPTGGSTGDVLTKDSGSNFDFSWQPPSTVADLDDLGDVNTTGASNGDVLAFNSGVWAPEAPSGGSTVIPNTPIYEDNFTSGTINAFWGTPDGTVTATGGKLRINATSTKFLRSNANYYMANKIVQVELATVPTLTADINPMFLIRDSDSGSNYVYINLDSGNFNIYVLGITYVLRAFNGTTDKFLRIIFDGVIVTFQVSQDAVTWETLGVYQDSTFLTIKMYIYLRQSNFAGTPAITEYDNFKFLELRPNY